MLSALQRDGWAVVRQRGSHVRLAKRINGELAFLTVPRHASIKPGTLAAILEAASMPVERLRELL